MREEVCAMTLVGPVHHGHGAMGGNDEWGEGDGGR